MDRVVLVLVGVVLLGVSGCAKAPILKDDAASRFQGFTQLPIEEGRLILVRGGGVEPGIDPSVVEVGGCKLEIGVRQFAVCRVAPGRTDIISKLGIHSVEIENGTWACVRWSAEWTDVLWREINCEDAREALNLYREVWTTQIPREEILELPGRQPANTHRVRRTTNGVPLD